VTNEPNAAVIQDVETKIDELIRLKQAREQPTNAPRSRPTFRRELPNANALTPRCVSSSKANFLTRSIRSSAKKSSSNLEIEGRASDPFGIPGAPSIPSLENLTIAVPRPAQVPVREVLMAVKPDRLAAPAAHS
jgi:hypothetical protein